MTVLGGDQMARQGTSNVAQLLNEIPAFRAQSSPATSAIYVSNLGASTADLRGLGGNRTLVLIDGRRVVASTVAGGSFTPANLVDLNLVPTSLLQRAEVVTGGASAAYGSDAVAGVTNLIINRDLTGLRGSMQYGQTEAGDNEEYFLSLAYGTHFADNRGRFIIGAERVDNSGTGDCSTRAWCNVNYNAVSNPFVTGSTRVLAGQPATLLLPNTTTATSSLNGLVVLGALKGLEFNPNGTTFQHDYGVYGSGLFQSGGGDGIMPFYQYFPLSAPSERTNIFSNLDYEITDHVKVFLEGSYGHVQGRLLGAQRRDISPAGAYNIARDNAFLPASVLARMVQTNTATLAFGRIWDDIGPQIGEVKRNTYRVVTGFDWKVTDALSVEGYYQYGQTDYSQRGYNTTINSRMNFAIDSVLDTNGNIVCRATLAGPAFRAAAAGCVPLNPFGAGASSPAARAYVTGTVMQDTKIKQHVASLTLKGDLIDLWAGPLSFATGGEYRWDGVESTIDAISATNDFYTSPGGGIVGGSKSLNVKEGFVEVDLPLAKDLPFAQSASLNGAVRFTDYSTSGSVTTWKIGAEWAPTKFLRFRATRSRDIRAPNLFDLYSTPQSSFQAVDDPVKGVRVLIPTLLSGNANLMPEIGDTWTAGAIITANMGSAGTFRISADYYDIKLNGAISTLGAQVIVTRCFQGSVALCPLITRNSTNDLTQIINANLNLNTLITRGVDIEADYAVRLGARTKLNLRVLSTVVKDLITIDTAGVAVDRAGQNGAGVSQPSGLPSYIINASASLQHGPLSGQVQLRYISKGRYQVTNIGPDEAGYSTTLANSININSVPAVAYVNLNAQYKIWESGESHVELFGVVNNLFDKDPPNNIPSSFAPTNPVVYDTLGRSYKVGVRFAF
ncbi:MAG: TonB-dependent receptor [Sphingobium sp.]|nr:TonB-dependent receptor [Sphingobium sp.]